MEPQKITTLAKLLRNNGDKILSSEFKFTLTGSMLHALNKSFKVIAESVDIGNPQDFDRFEVLKPMNSKSPDFCDLQLIYDFVQKTAVLCVVHYPGDEYFAGTIDISKFRALTRLELQKTNVQQIVGIKSLRSQLQHLICVKSLRNVEEIITHCGGDQSNGFVWNELKVADFSFNNLQRVDSSLEFAQNLQHLNLRHNQLVSVEAIKWLPHLKTIDLGFNRLSRVPQFHPEACKQLQSLNISNNFVEDLMDVTKLDALTDFDLSDNCLLDHICLLPLSALMTLKFLNLNGNPLYCHPRHRLETVQYLHKNIATVKFLLDFQPLSNSEKAVSGKQQLRHVSIQSRVSNGSASISINSNAPTTTSSAGSLISFGLPGSYTEAETATVTPDSAYDKKPRAIKSRNVKIEDQDVSVKIGADASITEDAIVDQQLDISMTESLLQANAEHLEAKKQMETLREKYGSKWLQSASVEMMQNTPGDGRESLGDEGESLEEYLSEVPFSNDKDWILDQTERTSTPIDDSRLQKDAFMSELVTPTKSSGGSEHDSLVNVYPNGPTVYAPEDTLYTTANEEPVADSSDDPLMGNGQPTVDTINEAVIEAENSEPEDDEKTYIVYADQSKDAIFLVLTANFLRERDTLSSVTKTKWSLKILESCELLKANTLRLRFDTVKPDKQQRVYDVQDNLCQELEQQLRTILEKRDHSSMNQAIYRCVKCETKFVIERNQYYLTHQNVRCPNCGSTFVVESSETRCVATPTIADYEPSAQPERDETNSIGNGAAMVGANNTIRNRKITQEAPKSSANSLNESSSCSKLTNSESSCDSNESVVGSSNTDRVRYQASCESDVDILSNPSQSSIEVLDGQYNHSRKTSSEERGRLQTIQSAESLQLEASDSDAKQKTGNLTESSSSGSPSTDSVCTAYDKAEKSLLIGSGTPTKPQNADRLFSTALLSAERNVARSLPKSSDNNNDRSLTSALGLVFHSTNLLMTGTKKNSDNAMVPPAVEQSKVNGCTPYKYNYTDFAAVDHRLKLYFYQNKFQENEHVKWLVRGRIYNEQTGKLCNGLLLLSTCKLYLMEAYAPEQDSVSQWLRQVISVTVNRLECIEVLPWKMGLTFTLRGWGGFLLLLQDILRTDSLLLYFDKHPLPSECELKYQPAALIQQRLSNAVGAEQVQMCSLLNSCEVICESAKRIIQHCVLLTTDNHLYVTNSKLAWLSLNTPPDTEPDLEICVTQLMSNLTEVDRDSEQMYTIKYLDELHDKVELWRCSFETAENAASFRYAISQSYMQLFSVPL